MNVRIAFGKDSLLLDIPDGWVGNRVLRSPRSEPVADLPGALDSALRDPLCAHRIAELLTSDDHLCIAIDETGRAKPLTVLIPPLIEWFEKVVRIPASQMLFLMVEPLNEWSAPDGSPSLGPEIGGGGSRVVLHGLRDSAECVEVGTLSNGLPLYLDRNYVQAKRRVLLSLVEPRPLWGYSGGRATILPGLSSAQSRRHFLGDQKNLQSPAAVPGNLRDNPFHLLALEAYQKAPAQLAIHFTVNRDDQITGVFAGDPVQSHLAAVNDYRKRFEPALPEPMDIVVTGAGGWPSDGTLADTVRSMASACSILKPGGTLIVLSSCERGIGPPAFESVLRQAGNPQQYFALAAKEGFRNPFGWLAHPFFRILGRHEVLFYSKGIPEDDLWQIGLTPAPEPAEAVSVAMESHGQDCKIAVIPEGWRTQSCISA